MIEDRFDKCFIIEGQKFDSLDQLLLYKDNVKRVSDFNKKKSSPFIEIENIKFVGCHFKNIDWAISSIIHTSFENCTFDEIKWFWAEVKNAEFHDVEIRNSELSKTSFYKCNFLNCLFENSDFSEAEFRKCSYLLFIDNCNLISSKILENHMQFEISFNHNDRSVLGNMTQIEKYNIKEDEILDKFVYDNMEFSNAIHCTYDEFAQKFEENRLMDRYGELFYLYKCALHNELPLFKRIASSLYFLSCGYGEKPFRTLGLSSFIILFCSILYLFMGLRMDTHEIVYSAQSIIQNNFCELLSNFLISFHFSIVTFTTVGYGNITPIHGSLLISSIEMVLGVIMTGLFVSTLVRKMSR